MQLGDRVLLLDKEPGVTSFAVVRRVRRIGRLQKAGHCGSLDPLATGLLLVCTGVGTRLTSIFVDLAKEYLARIRFGRATDTYDADGRVTQEAPVPPLDAELLRGALRWFEGEIEQKPPMHSAVKVQGRRLYELAREGLEVERVARRVVVHEIALLDLGAEHADIRVKCGRGCYVRSIAHELGERLGVPAHLEALRRVAVGPFRAEAAVQLGALEAAAGPRAAEEGGARGRPAPERLARAILTIPAALDFLPALHLRPGYETAILHGKQPEPRFLRELPRAPGTLRLLSDDGERLVALGVAGLPETPRLRLLRVFDPPLATSEGEQDPE